MKENTKENQQAKTATPRVLEMHRLRCEGYSVEEVAEAVKSTPASVRTSVNKAIRDGLVPPIPAEPAPTGQVKPGKSKGKRGGPQVVYAPEYRALDRPDEQVEEQAAITSWAGTREEQLEEYYRDLHHENRRFRERLEHEGYPPGHDELYTAEVFTAYHFQTVRRGVSDVLEAQANDGKLYGVMQTQYRSPCTGADSELTEAALAYLEDAVHVRPQAYLLLCLEAWLLKKPDCDVLDAAVLAADGLGEHSSAKVQGFLLDAAVYTEDRIGEVLADYDQKRTARAQAKAQAGHPRKAT